MFWGSRLSRPSADSTLNIANMSSSFCFLFISWKLPPNAQRSFLQLTCIFRCTTQPLSWQTGIMHRVSALSSCTCHTGAWPRIKLWSDHSGNVLQLFFNILCHNSNTSLCHYFKTKLCLFFHRKSKIQHLLHDACNQWRVSALSVMWSLWLWPAQAHGQKRPPWEMCCPTI